LNGIEASATADQTAAEIRTLVESASDSNVFTDADHTKLNGIEASATADQTVSEIKSLIAGSPLDATHLAANSVDSSELVDGSVDTSHLSADCVDATKIADNAIGSEHLQANSVGTSEIADAELTTLAGMQSGTASKLADSTALTADIADLNQIDGMAKQTTITDDDTKFPTSGAVVDYVAAQIAPIGGLEVIANEDSFPTTQPSSGVVISISDIEGLVVNGSGVATNARTTGNGSDNVTINGFPSSLQSKTMAAGLGLMVSSTGSSQTYTYHKLLAKEADVEQLSNDINDFAARYRVGSSNPTTDLDAGDLFFNTSTQKLLVYNSTNSAWEEAQSIGNFFISTFSESFDGSRTDFTVSNAPANAQQIILSINGVVQKPNAGTSTPSEGFALSGSTVKLSSAPASGSDVFIVVMGSTVNIGTPSNNTVTSAILQNGAVTTAKIADNAVTGAKILNGVIDNNKLGSSVVSAAKIVDGNVTTAKIAADAVTNAKIADGAITLAKLEHGTSSNNGKFLRANNGADPSFETVNTDLVADTTPQLGGHLDCQTFNIDISDSAGTSSGRLNIGASQDLVIYHDGTDSYIQSKTNDLFIDNDGDDIVIRTADTIFMQVNNNENCITCLANGSVELYYDNSKKLETVTAGISVTGQVSADNLHIGDGSTGIKVGDSDDLQIYHDGTHSFLKNTGGNLVLQGNGTNSIVLQSVVGENAIICNANAAVELYHDATKKLETTSYGSQVTGYQVQTNFPIASVSDVNTGNLNTTTLQDAQLNSSNFYSYTILNQGNHFSASTGKFTCPVDGVYRIYFRISSTANANIRLRKNGNTINEAYDSGYSSGDTRSVSSEIIVGCSANDYLDIQVSTLRVVSGNQHKQVTFQLIA